MILIERLAQWLDVRPGEIRTVSLSFGGSFLVIAALTLGRSLREALFLTHFDIKSLPYIIAAVSVLSVPAVGAFSFVLSRQAPQTVMKALLVILALGLGIIWLFVPRSRTAVIAFYLWTALGTLLLSSCFWVVMSELYALRGAKRLFSLIGAGGTAGAMIMGNSLNFLTRRFDPILLIPGLIAVLGALWLVHVLLPRPSDASDGPPPSRDPIRSPVLEALRLVRRSPHLRTMALIVVCATMASTLVDYQFKELAVAEHGTTGTLTGFFGAFYGWTGGIALFIQLLLAARIMSAARISASLAILPLILLAGAPGLLLVPSLFLATLVKGGDNAIRKSLHRSALEVLYVPIPSMLRRKTKTFIDSVVDSLAGGAGAALIVIWVTGLDLPSRYLMVFVMIIAASFLVLSRRMDRHYIRTVTEQLDGRARDAAGGPSAARVEGQDLLSASFTRLDFRAVLQESGVLLAPAASQADQRPDRPPPAAASPASVLDRLASPDHDTVAQTLEEFDGWDESHVTALARLLVRDDLRKKVVKVLARMGDGAVPRLAELLRSDDTDFVIRRRIPEVLSRTGGPEADDVLLASLGANRFEVRYRSAVALMRRRKAGLPQSRRNWKPQVWDAVRAEVSRERPVWEFQKLLDGSDMDDDTLVVRRVGFRGELSLEHTFRLLTLVLDPQAVRNAFHGIVTGNEKLKSLALEYLELVLPDDIRDKLWPFIGDLSQLEQKRDLRTLDEVVSDLITTGATLLASPSDREALRKVLEDRDDEG